MIQKRVGLVVGHTSTRPGACNKNYNICEYQFNEKLAYDIRGQLHQGSKPDIEVIIIKRISYRQLPADVNNCGPDFCISLHCNAFNTKWNGTEVLYYYKSAAGKKLATILQKNLLIALGFKDRGIHGKTVEDRGGHLLKHTAMPCVIAEPFFIDNDRAYKKVQDNYQKLVNAYINTMREAFMM